MSSHRISRVFLQNGNDFNEFLISSLDVILNNGIPSLEQQIRQSMVNRPVSLALRVEKIDSHWLVEDEGRVVRVVDFYNDLPSKCYDYAVEEAKRRAKMYSDATNGRIYNFIDITSRADIRMARVLSGEVTYRQ
jgi:hypothetical protein